MNLTKNTIAYFEGEAPFNFRIEKAIAPTTEGKKMILEGVASSPNIDHDGERMAVSALKRMANIINEKSVPLRLEHHKGEDAIVGKVIEGSVDERGNLKIKAELDPTDKRSSKIYNAIKTGTQLGYSVGGRVKNAIREMSQSIGKEVKTFYDVILDEVSLTPRPANFDAYAIAKHIAYNENDADQFRFTKAYDDFLMENPQLDYLAMIEKSIPNNSWTKVEQSTEDIMKKLFYKDTDEDTTETDSTETESERKSFKQYWKEASDSSTDDTETTETETESETKTKHMRRPYRKTSESDESSETESERKSYRTRKTGSDEDTTTTEETTTTETASKSYVDSRVNSIINLLKAIRKDISTVDPSASALDSESTTAEKDETMLGSDVDSDQTERETGSSTSSLDEEAVDQREPTESKTDEYTTSTTKARKANLRKTAEQLLRMSMRILKEEREGQEDTIGNGDNSASREETGTATETFDTSAMDQENPSTTKSRRRYRKTSDDLSVGTGTLDATPAMDQSDPDETKTESETTKNRRLAYTMLKTAKRLLKDTYTPTDAETTSGMTSNTDENLSDFETMKELTMTETTSTGTDSTDSNLEDFETMKEGSSSMTDDSDTGRFSMSDEDDEESLISTHDIPDSSESTNSYGSEYKVSEKFRRLKKSAPIDIFSAHVSKRYNDLVAKYEKDHQRLVGLESQFMDSIHKNESLQKHIGELMKIPGPKQSVIGGVPYMFEKDGRKLPLWNVKREDVDFNKSTSNSKSFKEFWKSEKATIYDNQ